MFTKINPTSWSIKCITAPTFRNRITGKMAVEFFRSTFNATKGFSYPKNLIEKFFSRTKLIVFPSLIRIFTAISHDSLSRIFLAWLRSTMSLFFISFTRTSHKQKNMLIDLLSVELNRSVYLLVLFWTIQLIL